MPSTEASPLQNLPPLQPPSPETLGDAHDPPHRTSADHVGSDWRIRNIPRRCYRGVCSASEWLFGMLSLVVGLSVLATIPVVQFLSLGYLLEATGRVIRTGRLRNGFFGVRTAARVGSIVLGTWLVLLPLRFLADLNYSSYLVNEDRNATPGLRAAVVVLSALALVHIVWAWFRGGRLRHFVWPAPIRLFRRICEGRMYRQACDAIWEFVVGLRLPYYFWLGLRGFLGAFLWLLLPVTIMVVGSRAQQPEAAALMGLLGGLLMAAVLLYLPFLQARFAAERRWRCMFEVRTVRSEFGRAPIAYWIALLATLALAVPLYLLKAELIPREAAWLPSLVFVTFIFPARLLVGWSVARARRRERPRLFLFRWLARLAALPVVGIYVVIVYFTQFISWHGALSLYEQHAFMVPVPFLGM